MAERAGQADHEEGEEQGPEKDTSTSDDQNGDFVTVGESPDIYSIEDQHPIQTEEESECPVCQSIGVLTLHCGHKLCLTCSQLSQEELGQASCTICYRSQLMDLVLHTLLDVLFQAQPRRYGAMPGTDEGSVRGGEDGRKAWSGYSVVENKELCVQHGQRLTTFCLQEKEVLCQQCHTDEHEGHQCCSIEEAIRNCKRELLSAHRGLQEQLETLTFLRQSSEDTAAHIKNQSVQTAKILRDEFEKMHQYLRDEEVALMSQLKQEEEDKSHRMKEKIERIKNDIRALTNSIREAENAMTFDNVLFLKNYKGTCERAQCRVDEPEEESEALLDVAKYQSCVQHQVWDKMLRTIEFYPVTMDPNTGSVCLGVSPDLSTVYVCEEQPLPDNPERFVSPEGILGSEGFSSGRHSWEVEVGDNSHWSLGVASEIVRRKDSPAFNTDREPTGGMWTVSLSSGEYWASSDHSTPLRLRRRPRIVRIQLDWERGCLTFSDTNDNNLIYRFKQQWSGNLRPYFSTTCSKHPLKITAGRVIVITD